MGNQSAECGKWEIRTDASSHDGNTTGDPDASADRTFLDLPKGGAVRKCVNSEELTVQTPPSFKTLRVSFSAVSGSNAVDTNTQNSFFFTEPKGSPPLRVLDFFVS